MPIYFSYYITKLTYLFPVCEFFNSINIKPDKKLTYLFDKINPKPKFWRHSKNQINAIPYQYEQRGRGHEAYEETKKRSSGRWECVIVFGYKSNI